MKKPPKLDVITELMAEQITFLKVEGLVGVSKQAEITTTSSDRNVDRGLMGYAL